MIGMMAEMDILDTVIVRPHPSKEDHNFYEAHFSSSDSIVVETSGDVRPWILGSHVVIHNSCTSGVEAALMNQPVIAYKPKIDVGISNRKSLPNNVSEAVDTKSELNSIINAIWSDTHQELKSNDQRSQLCERFANFENLAASQIVKVVSEQIGAANYPQSIQLRHKLSRITRSHLASYIPKLSNKHTFSSSQKYPGTTQSEIYDFITKVKDERMVPDVRVQNLSGFKEIYLLERDT
jgi:hypothetical protein